MCAILVAYKNLPENSYKILDVTDNSMLIIDLNHNNKADKDEIFAIKDVNIPKPLFSEKTTKFAQKSGLNFDEAMTLAYVANEYLKKNYKGKEVVFEEEIPPFNEKYGYRFAKLKTKEGLDIAYDLLNGGLAIAYKEGVPNPYLRFENLSLVVENAKYFSKLNLVALNLNNGIYHNLNCKYAKKLKKFKLITQKEAKEKYKPCKICAHYKMGEIDISNYIDKIENPVANAALGGVSYYFIDPNKYKKPSSRARTSAAVSIIEKINEAKTSIDIALYGFDSQNEIYEALLSAKRRGVKIRFVVETTPIGTNLYSDTMRLFKDFEVKTDKLPNLMHNKFFIIDKKLVITGTMNISSTGSGGYNSNTVVFLNSPEAAKVFENEFLQMFEGKFQKFKQDFSKKDIKIGKSSVDIYFSPKSNVLGEAILPTLKSAKRQILVNAFYLTQKSVIEELIAASKRNVEVKVIADAVYANAFRKRVEYLKQGGVKVKVENWGGKNHEKNILADGCTLIVGSANFSQNAISKNDENTLVIKNCELNGAYQKHFFNLYNSIDEKYLSKIPRSESFESKNSCYDGIDNNFDGKIDSLDEGCIPNFSK